MYQVQVNDDNIYQVDVTDGVLTVGTKQVDWDLSRMSDGSIHIIRNGKSYRVRLVKADYEEKTLTVRINNHDYRLLVKDRFDLLLSKLGMSDLAAAKVNDIKAPMPGLVLEILVEPGQQLHKGDQVLILEAMKMENVLKSPGEGTIKAIKVEQGDAVEKNQVLVELE